MVVLLPVVESYFAAEREKAPVLPRNARGGPVGAGGARAFQHERSVQVGSPHPDQLPAKAGEHGAIE